MIVEALLLGGATVAAAAVTFGSVIAKFLSAPVVLDVVASGYFLSTYAATNTAIGLQTAVASILIVTITIRAWRFLFGYEEPSLNGDSSWSTVVAHLITTSIGWIRQSSKSLFTGKPVVAPQYQLTWRRIPGRIDFVIMTVKRFVLSLLFWRNKTA